MQAQFDRARSDATLILAVIWTAGILATIFGLVVYFAVQSYDPALSCSELYGKAHIGGVDQVPKDLDAWDDYELLCHDGYGRPSVP
jgi:hypothetical protein